MSNAAFIAQPIPFNSAQEKPEHVNHNFLYALIAAVCLCPPIGIIALAYSIKSSAKTDVGFYDKARLYSRRARIWSHISVAVCVLMIFLYTMYFFTMVNYVTRHYRGQ